MSVMNYPLPFDPPLSIILYVLLNVRYEKSNQNK